MSAAAINTAPAPAAGAPGQASPTTGVGAAHGAQTSGLPAIFENMLASLTAAEIAATPVASSGQVKGANLTVGVGKVSESDDKTKAKDDATDAAAATTATATTPPDAALALIVPAVATTPNQVAAAASASGEDADDATANTLSGKTFGLAAAPNVAQAPGATAAADADKAKTAAALAADGAATNANATAKADTTATAVSATPAQPQAPAPTPAPVDPSALAPQLPASDPMAAAAAAAAAAASASAKTAAATPNTNNKPAAPKVAAADAPKPPAGPSDLAVTAANANAAGKTADALTPIAGGASKAADKEGQAAAAEAETDQPATTPTPADPATSATTTPATLAAAAAAAVVRGSPQTVANLSAEIVKKLDARSTQFDVQLDPAGLGKVDVRVQIGADGKMSAAMSFDTPQAAAELRARSNELQQALAQSGFDVTGGMSFDVSTDRGQNGQAQNQQPDNGAAFRGRAFQAALDTTADTPPVNPLSSRRTSASGVDIRI